MRPSSLALTLAAAASALLSLPFHVQALGAVSRQGRYLFDDAGNRFYIKGVAYQKPGTLAAASAANNANGGFPEPSDYSDPLADDAACNRDLPYLKQLGINTIRAYSVNASNNHDACMHALSAAGIYVMIDLSLPLNGSIDRAAPTWDVGLLNEYLATVEAFVGYDNLLAVNVGNEVVNGPQNTNAAPFVKAAARDVKAYLKSINKSNVLVGYASTDGDSTWRNPLADYLACGGDDLSLDLYGLNNYEWCGSVSFQSSGYQGTTSNYQNFPLPAYFSEFGCVTDTTGSSRKWAEVAALFGSQMTSVWSGGLAFEYYNDTTGFGLTTVSGNTVTPNADFTALASAFAAASPTNSPTKAAAPANAPAPTCPPQTSNFTASAALPPTPDEAVCNCAHQNAWGCLVVPDIANAPDKIGVLTGQTCAMIGNMGGTCGAVSADGATGTYGNFSFCNAADRLSWAFSTYYEGQRRALGSCDFAGNATVNLTPANADAATSAASSCLAKAPAGGTFVPSGVSVPSSSSVGDGNKGGKGSGGGNGAASVVSSATLATAAAAAALAMAVGGVAVLI